MLKRVAFLLFLIVASPGSVFAAACGSNTNGCERYQWCETETDTNGTTSSCVSCTNGPTIDGKECHASGAICQYTQDGGTSNNCEWTCTPSDECNGYHKDGNTCSPNQETCNNENGFKIWNDSKCYITNCPNGQLVTEDTKCGIQYGHCENAAGLCSSVLANCNGEISGNYSNGDFSACKCTRTEDISGYGARKFTSTYVSKTGTLTEWSDATITVINCAGGYYAHNDTCEFVPANCYSGDNDTNAYKCPYGSRTDGTGATSAADCYFDSTTPFTDKTNNSYTLPSDVKAYLSPSLLDAYTPQACQ